ncbi:MAG: D-alanine--D-alanine ligase [Gilvibacter sp.]
MPAINIAIIMGGYSSEKDISLQSGEIVYKNLQAAGHNVYKAHILESGWNVVLDSGKALPINKSDFSFKDRDTTIIPDVVFNVIHGTPGEDGYMQAYLELIGIPQTSSDFYAAALSFNKRDSLSVLKNFGVKCANSYYVNQGAIPPLEDIIKTVGLPCFVKPNRAGSSFGISKVYTLEELPAALEKAFKEDSEVLVETCLVGTEVSVGVYKTFGETHVLPPTEIVSENDFFDYEAKYLGQSEEITPARISEEAQKRVMAETKRIFTLLNAKGIARCDFILQDDVPYFLEINTNPGLSAESIIPRQARYIQLSLSTLFSDLVQTVLPNNNNS